MALLLKQDIASSSRVSHIIINLIYHIKKQDYLILFYQSLYAEMSRDLIAPSDRRQVQ
jgi:hypothetical protein